MSCMYCSFDIFPVELLFMHRVLLIRWFYLKMGRLVNRNYFDGKNIKRNVHETEKQI